MSTIAPRPVTEHPSPSLATTIAQRIAMEILSGRHKPGESIGGEVTASKEMSVSRGTYREAMNILAAKGLIERRRRAGTHVAPSEQWNLLDVDMILWRSESDNVERFVANLAELRRAIEPEAAALAAERRTKEDLARMRQALELMSSDVRLIKHSRMPSKQFRKALLQASGNFYFTEVGRVIERVTSLMDTSAGGCGNEGKKRYVEVCDAIAAHDGSRARTLMSEIIASDGRNRTGV